MKNNLNKKYLLEVLVELLKTPSPSGFCYDIMGKIERRTNELGYGFELTKKGCGVITVPGKDSGYTVGLSAHVDTLGAMVRSVKNTGGLKFIPIGGYMLSTVEGEYCQIHTREGKVYDGTVLTTQPSVHVFREAREQKREEANMEIRIDEVVKNKKDVEKLGISVGDFISFDPRVVIKENGFIKSRHLDDKAGVAVIFAMLELLKREGLVPLNNLKVIISNYEEVGHGAAYIPADIDELLAVDMGAMGDDLCCTEQQVSICAKDSHGPYDYKMVGKLIELAKREKLNYAVDIYPHYGSDASTALEAGNNIRAALIGPGVHASHSMERTHLDGLLNSAALLAAYVLE